MTDEVRSVHQAMEKNMGILDTIKEKLFGKAAPTPAAPAAAPVLSAEIPAAVTPVPTASAAANTPVVTPIASVDVEAILEAAVKAKGIKLNWRTSIVDLMKALDLDSSLKARIELAKDLNYTGKDTDGSAEKNIWLHKALMKTLAENGGKIPKELLD
ncbi:DUF3597 domain-containing protein [Breznakiellaceae bacterium SP9]